MVVVVVPMKILLGDCIKIIMQNDTVSLNLLRINTQDLIDNLLDSFHLFKIFKSCEHLHFPTLRQFDWLKVQVNVQVIVFYSRVT